METIHFKTVDPVSQGFLKEAAAKGLELNWERYEQQQPQDGFLRLGLACPYGCMQGPCRIDPYGRGAEAGVCGLGRDAMAAAFLLRLTLQGALEAMAGRETAEIRWPAALQKKASAALGKTGGAVSSRDIFAGAAMLVRPALTPEALIGQAIRLAVLAVGLSNEGKAPGSRSITAGYGLLAGEGALIGLTGRIPEAFAQAVQKEAAGRNAVRVLSLGDWIPAGKGFVPIACTSGEAEALLSSATVNLLVAGPGSDPGLLALAGKMRIPVRSALDKPAAVLREARKAFDRRVPAAVALDASLIGEGTAAIGANEVRAALTGQSGKKLALVGGADTLFTSLGHLPGELAKALIAEGYRVGAWGDAALWMVKQGLDVAVLEGPVAALKAGADPRGICFTGLKTCREFAEALGLAALGTKVSLAVPLPLWGSEQTRTLLGKRLAALGGGLAHFDLPATGEEILAGFGRRKR